MMSESRWFRLKRHQEAERLARFLDWDGAELGLSVSPLDDSAAISSNDDTRDAWNGGAS